MDTKRLIAAAGAISLITLTGAGCTKSILKSSNDNGSNSGSNSQNDNAFNNSINLEIPEGNKSNDVAQNVVESVLGKVKITSFLQDFPVKGGMTVEYTANRNITDGDFGSLVKAVKNAGYTIEMSGLTEGSGAIISNNKKDTLMFTFTVGEPKIAASIGPYGEFSGGDDYENSSS